MKRDNLLTENNSNMNRSGLTWYTIALLIIIGVGTFLRVYHLGKESLWVDEGYTIRSASLDLYELFELTSTYDQHPPLYYGIVHFWIKVFGDSETALRMPSAIFGSLIILVLYKIGRLLFSRNMALIGALLCSVSLFQIYYSQEARSYILLALLASLSTYYFLLSMRNKSKKMFTAYLISSFLLMHCHIYGMFVIIAQNICIAWHLLAKNKRQNKITLRQWMFLQFVLLILFIPWGIFLWRQMQHVLSGFWIKRPTLMSIVDTLQCFCGGNIHYGNNNLGKISLCIMVMLCFNALFRITGKRILLREWLSGRLYLLLWLVVPIALPFLISQVASPIYLTRGAIVASIPLILLMTKGIDCLRFMSLKVLCVVALVCISLLDVYVYYRDTDKEQWRELVQYIEEQASSADLVVITSARCYHNAYSYYANRSDITVLPYPPDVPHPFERPYLEMNQEYASQLRSTIRDYPCVWLVLSHDKKVDPSGLVRTTLQSEFPDMQSEDFLGIELLRFTRSSSPN
ncbi:MAG: glycosyltransferase family 39 protein [Sedimentisphaerales bacterium]|nr:glycosyltransferase family 39 protein [Sedimentisphaerales bacterium]